MTITTSQTEEYLHKDKVLALLEEHVAGKRDHSRKLWTVLCFMVWHAIYMEKVIEPRRTVPKEKIFN